MFYDSSRFAFTEVLERNWQRILQDYLAIRNDLTDWSERELYGAGWQVFGIYNFPHGEALEPNVQRCAHTAALVAQQFQHHGAVGFSVLQPGTHIKPHRGYPGSFLRCHLGLQIPAGNCGLKVERETRHWQPGKTLVFDDRFLHEAWNLTATERVVLLIDFIPESKAAPTGPGEDR